MQAALSPRAAAAPSRRVVCAPVRAPAARAARARAVAPARRAVAASAVAAPAAAVPAAKTTIPKAQQKPTAVITGASSGLGLAAAVSLAKTKGYHVVMACRDYSKADAAAKAAGVPRDAYSVMHLDLASLDSVRAFVDAFRASGRRLDALVANAAVYTPTAKEPRFTADGFELSAGVNHLGHFLLCNLLLDDLQASPSDGRPVDAPRMVIVGSITGNTNTLAGNVPPKADLGDLRGLAAGVGPGTTAMMDGGEFDGAKAYKGGGRRRRRGGWGRAPRAYAHALAHAPPHPSPLSSDSKVCNMLTMREFHRRFHPSTGVVFGSLYPGCIASSGLFREHYPLFRTIFPAFQKYVTKGYVSEADAGARLASVVADPALSKSGVYWSFSDATGTFENEVSDEVADGGKGRKLWELSEKLVGLA